MVVLLHLLITWLIAQVQFILHQLISPHLKQSCYTQDKFSCWILIIRLDFTDAGIRTLLTCSRQFQKGTSILLTQGTDFFTKSLYSRCHTSKSLFYDDLSGASGVSVGTFSFPGLKFNGRQATSRLSQQKSYLLL